MEIRFTVPGPPVPKARPRHARTPSGKPVTYTPEKTVRYENWVRLCAREVKPDQLLDGPLVLEVEFYFRRPKSVPKRRLFPHVKPDLTNLLSALMDALNGYLWTDDARVFKVVAAKRYGDPPRAEVRVLTLEN